MPEPNARNLEHRLETSAPVTARPHRLVTSADRGIGPESSMEWTC
jgi:hypothetical protein